jgi:endonuclease/exonuclease/phosphatase family metal-dependent hydrolase
MVEDEYPYSVWDASTLEEFSPLSNGLLILSKYPIHRKRFLRYEMNDDIVDRAVLAATVVKDDEWSLHVVCTHLQAGLDGGDQDPPPATSNAGVRAAQLAELEDFVEANGYEDGPSVLLGDFNAGPDPDPTDMECPGGGGSCPTTCTPTDSVTVANAVAAGWTDRADDLAFTPCTYCMPEARDLEYIPLYPCEGSQRIDHCLTRGTGDSQITAIVRDMTQAIDEVIPGDSMNRHARTLSDHYAVRCTIAE